MRPMKLPHLGGLTATQFFRDYWQKKPLLIRQAFPGFSGLLSAEELAGLACEEQVQSRLIMHKHDKWQMESGPFAEKRFTKLPKHDWTLLVQEVNHFLPEAASLLQHFNFIPLARLDDLMVSFAPDGGGVGPHFDSYDVFLLQGMGKRLWRISDQDDHELIVDAPLRILRHFETQQEWLLETGDMLYLPPRYAHWGIAEGDCMTYSIGFRAPSAQEIATQFLSHLQDTIKFDGMYSDPDLAMQLHPAEIPQQMTSKIHELLKNLTWDESDVSHFLGIYLTEPKAHVTFTPPKTISLERFIARLRKERIELALQSKMLFCGDRIYINGEAAQLQTEGMLILRQLADQRFLPPTESQNANMEGLLYTWYLAGYLRF
jgi:50S ribosomal protein L16 3-hydroxylase